MAKPRQLPSKKWNIRPYIGKDASGRPMYKSYTVETKAEALRIDAQYRLDRAMKKKKAARADYTVRECIDLYIARRELLSPTTASNYRKLITGGLAFEGFLDFPVAAIDEALAQKYVNMEAHRKTLHGGRISPKTVRNEWSLITSSVKAICGVEWPNIVLPRPVKKLKLYPEPEDVLQAVIGSSVELPCLLAMWLSFTMSEIKGLKCSSIIDGYIFIRQVRVYADGEEIEKDAAKVYDRNRIHRLPEYLEQLIRKTSAWREYERTGADAWIIPESRDLIYRRFRRLVLKAGIDISFHDLRHISASIGLNELGLPAKVMQERGGWKTDNVMKTVYSHTFSSTRKESDRLFDEYFDNLICNKICNKPD